MHECVCCFLPIYLGQSYFIITVYNLSTYITIKSSNKNIFANSVTIIDDGMPFANGINQEINKAKARSSDK